MNSVSTDSAEGNKGKLIAILVPVLLVVIYIYPRVLVHLFGMDNPWTSFLYHYGFGIAFFSIGMMILIRSGAMKPGRGRDSMWKRVLILGLVGYLSVHAIWMILAQTVPFIGE